MRSADVGSWLECLRAFTGPPERRGDLAATPPEDLVRILTIAVYVGWLGGLSGESGPAEEAGGIYDAISTHVLSLHRREPSSASRTGLGILLAMMGYSALGRTHVPENQLSSPDLALLFEPSDSAKVTAVLRDFAAAEPDLVFIPALFRYCHALLRLGALTQVRALVERHGRRFKEGMFIDVIGVMHEQLGQWREATEAYRKSSWPQHIYRAEVCEGISRGTADSRHSEPEQKSQGAIEMPREMALSSTEIGQAELARSVAFINACRWNSFDNWLIRFEMGKLAFRRRRHVEAESYLKQALADAPRGRRYPISGLRFSNLTWLSSESLYRDLPMKPEALLIGRDAIQCALDEEKSGETVDAARIRVWIASETGDKRLLEPVLKGKDEYFQGLAHEKHANVPGALDCWLRCLGQRYEPRALFRLIHYCYSGNLTRTAEFLVRLVEMEALDDFFVLWELGKELQSAVRFLGEGSDEFRRHQEAYERISNRVHDLGRFDYQGLLRAYEYFRGSSEHHIAETLLSRAAQLADGPEENLAIAVARRLVPRVAVDEVDRQGLLCLTRAERESRDRLERLQIAREYFHYGQPTRARRILREEGIVDTATAGQPLRLDHIEFIVALQCAAWLSRNDIARIAEAAIDSLEQDILAGKIRTDVKEFVKRLWRQVYAADEVIGMRLESRFSAINEKSEPVDVAEQGARAVDADSRWTALWTEIVDANFKDQPDDEEKFLDEATGVLADAPPGFRIALWQWLRGEIRGYIAEAAVARPRFSDERMPVLKRSSMIDLRTQELCDLWRAVLTPESHAEASVALERFFTRERRIMKEWETARRSESEKPMQRAIIRYKFAERVLRSMLVPESSGSFHPALDGFYQSLAEDARFQLERLATYRESPIKPEEIAR
jgi:hypothetical protein